MNTQPHNTTDTVISDEARARNERAIADLRLKLLDLSNRNALINFPIGSSRSSYVRIVDKSVPSFVAQLQAKDIIDILPVPDAPVEPEDETTPEFKDLLKELKEQSETYQAEIKALGARPKFRDKARIERNIRDELRETLGMTPWKRVESATVYAKELGIDTSYDLRLVGSQDELKRKEVQTLFFPDDLEARLEKIDSSARSHERDAGVHTLYAAIGFLHWAEDKNSTQFRHAPLLLWPIKFTSRLKEGHYEFTVESHDEDETVNQSLIEKMRLNYGLQVPALEDFENSESGQINIAAWLTAVESAAKRVDSRWGVKPWVVMGLMSFHKIALYNDLDPKLWDRLKALGDNPLLNQIFSGGEAWDGLIAPVHAIDEIEAAPNAPLLVLDADPSQHSAVVETRKGKSMVIQGPPGTGKSQTIANIISANLNDGKTVLFMAEKMAALKVVKDRLDKVSLGDFCLEIHSDKASKTAVLESLKSRMALDLPRHNERNFAEARRNLAVKREALTTYVTRINAAAGATDLTVHDVIWGHAATKHALDLLPADLRNVPIENALYLGKEDRAELKRLALALQNTSAALGDIAKPSMQAWRGINRTDFTSFDTAEAADILATAVHSIESLMTAADAAMGPVGWADRPANMMKLGIRLHAAIETIPTVPPANIISTVQFLAEDAQRALAEKLADGVSEYQKARDELLKVAGPEILDTRPDDLIRALRLAELNEISNTAHLKAELAQSDSNHKAAQSAAAAIEKLGRSLPIEELRKPELLGVFVKALEIDIPSAEVREKIRPELGKDVAVRQLKEAQTIAAAIDAAVKAIGGNVDLASIPSIGELRGHIHTIKEAGFFGRLFGGEFGRSKKAVLRITRDLAKAKTHQWTAMLESAVDWRTNLETYEQYRVENVVVAATASTHQARFPDLIAAAEWIAYLKKTIPAHIDGGSTLINFLQGIDDVTAEALTALLAQHRPSLQALASGNSATITAETDRLLERTHTLAELQSLQERFGWKQEAGFGSLGAAIATLNRLISAKTSIEQCETLAAGLVGIWNGVDTNPQIIRDAVASSRAIADWNIPARHRLFSTKDLPGDIAHIVSTLRSLAIAGEKAREEIDRATKHFELDLDSWGQATEVTQVSFDIFCRRALLAAANAEMLPHQCALVAGELDAQTNGLTAVVDAWRKADRDYSGLSELIDAFWFKSAARAVFAEDKSLVRSTGHNQQTLQDEFRRLDREVLRLNQMSLAARLHAKPVPQGSRSGSRRSYTDRELISHQAGLQRGHMPLRKLFDQASRAIVALKPCVMMSPLSVARFLKPGLVEFDVCVIDEASQMRPEDALCAFLRAKQVIVVGDSKQLPPSDLFKSLAGSKGDGDSDGDADDDGDNAPPEVIEESILELSQRSWQPPRSLLLHYRSRHQSLIQFSNEHFYNGNLVIFPSSLRQSPTTGLNLVETGGVYMGAGLNPTEAQVVVDHAIRFMIEHPGQSLGIVAVNSKQQERIETLLRDAIAVNPHAQAYEAKYKGGLDELFIKNLDNVQGDERDVIFVSTVYGPTETGQFHQRFGPINNEGGARRLNVLFTRAKYRMTIFTSMNPDMIVHHGRKEGVEVLKNVLKFAKTGRMPIRETVDAEEAENFFEDWFLQKLRAAGYEADPQVGTGGYRVDIGVRHPEKPGTYILGIECDGATYHSSKVARERDRLRQMVLEDMGWKFHRVWSTDWFREPEVQFNLVVKRIESLRGEGRRQVTTL